MVHKFDPIGHLPSDPDDIDDDNNNNNVNTTAVSMGLLRVADTLCRKVLPWQATCCPCAVESFRDIRFQSIIGF